MDESGVEPETFRMLSERATNYATRPYLRKNSPRRYERDRPAPQPPKKNAKKERMVPGGIEPPILALLAPRLNQLGQGTIYVL